jgi:hypothetical protein
MLFEARIPFMKFWYKLVGLRWLGRKALQKLGFLLLGQILRALPLHQSFTPD